MHMITTPCGDPIFYVRHLLVIVKYIIISGITRVQFSEGGGALGGVPLFLRGHVNTCILQPQMGTYFSKF